MRLIEAGELKARKLPGSNYWQIPLATVLAFEERREGRANGQMRSHARWTPKARRLSERWPPRAVLDSDVIFLRVLMSCWADLRVAAAVAYAIWSDGPLGATSGCW